VYRLANDPDPDVRALTAADTSLARPPVHLLAEAPSAELTLGNGD
jgi:hypothetical protein